MWVSHRPDSNRVAKVSEEHCSCLRWVSILGKSTKAHEQCLTRTVPSRSFIFEQAEQTPKFSEADYRLGLTALVQQRIEVRQ